MAVPLQGPLNGILLTGDGMMRTVREKIFMGMALPVSLILLFCLYQAGNALKERALLSKAEHYTGTITLLLEAAGHQAVERGVTNTALRGASPAGKALTDKIALRREKGGAAFTAAMERLKTYRFSGQAEIYDAMETLYANADTLRARADTQMTLPSADMRDQKLLADWVPAMSRLIVKGQDTRYRLTGEIESRFPKLSRIARMMHFSWLSSEYAGRERAVIGGTLSGGVPISPQKLKLLSEFRGKTETGFAMAEKLLPSMSKETQEAFAASQALFFGAFQQLREDIYRAGMTGSAYPVDAGVWITRSTEAIDTILAVQQGLVADARAEIRRLSSRADITVLIACLVLAAAAFGTLAGRRVLNAHIVAPLADITATLKALSEGDVSRRNAYAERQDEIGDIARAAEIFRRNLSENMRLAEEREAAMRREEAERAEKAREKAQAAEREKETRLQAEREKRELRQKLADGFEQNAEGLISGFRDAVGALSATAEEMRELAERAAGQIEGAKSSAVSGAEDIADIVAAAEQLSQTQRHIAESISRADNLVRDTGERVAEADMCAAALANASEKVQSVVGIIADIARQTNLLAINAAVEAARAGATGNGFAVVAAEVKRLAGQTENSILDITRITEEIDRASGAIAGGLQKVRLSSGEMAEVSAAIAAAAEEQSADTENVSRAIAGVTEKSRAVSCTLTDVAGVSEKTGASAVSVTRASAELGVMSGKLDREISRFIAEIRG